MRLHREEEKESVLLPLFHEPGEFFGSINFFVFVISVTHRRRVPIRFRLVFFFVLVSDADQVGAQFLHGVRGCAGLYCLWVVCDEESLFRLDDNDSFSALMDKR